MRIITASIAVAFVLSAAGCRIPLEGQRTAIAANVLVVVAGGALIAAASAHEPRGCADPNGPCFNLDMDGVLFNAIGVAMVFNGVMGAMVAGGDVPEPPVWKARTPEPEPERKPRPTRKAGGEDPYGILETP